MGLQKYFEYKLLPWEEFVFALHNCTYTESTDAAKVEGYAKAAQYLIGYNKKNILTVFLCEE